VADHEPVAVGAVVVPDLLDAQVALNSVVAALARERGTGFLAVGAQLLADDVVAATALQMAAVTLGSKSAVQHPDHPGEVPAAQIVVDLPYDHLIRGVARERPHPDRDPVGGDGHRNHHLRQIRTMILCSSSSADDPLDQRIRLVGL
jgi:hypothetical protein